MPSLKNSCSGSPLMFWKGRTAIDGLSGKRKHRTFRSTIEADSIHPHRLRDVLQLLGAKVLIGKTDFCADFVVDLARHADTARFRDSLQPRSDVDAIAEDSIIVVDDVTEVDADTKLHMPLGLDCGIAFDHLPLNGDRAFDRVQHTRELGQQAVPGGINDTSAKLANHRQHDRLMALEVAHRARFVGHPSRRYSRRYLRPGWLQACATELMTVPPGPITRPAEQS